MFNTPFKNTVEIKTEKQLIKKTVSFESDFKRGRRIRVYGGKMSETDGPASENKLSPNVSAFTQGAAGCVL